MFQHLLTHMFICPYSQMTLKAMHQFQFPIRKPLVALCSHQYSLAPTYCMHVVAKYAECPQHMHSKEFSIISEGWLIIVCYINNVLMQLYLTVIVIGTTEETLMLANHK